jgi:hypothetical protein
MAAIDIHIRTVRSEPNPRDHHLNKAVRNKTIVNEFRHWNRIPSCVLAAVFEHKWIARMLWAKNSFLPTSSDYHLNEIGKKSLTHIVTHTV